MKKAQIGEVFIYLISTLIIILVLYYGYNAIKDIGKKQQALTVVKFQNDLSDLITSTASDYGTVRMEDIYTPGGVTGVCFVDPNVIAAKNTAVIPEYQTLIRDSVADGVKSNVFLLPEGNPFYIEKASVNGDFLCFPVVQGKFRIRVEGMGNRAEISIPT